MASNHIHDQFYKMFIHNLQDVVSAENQIIEALPRYLDAISSEDLREKLKEHYSETKQQKERLLNIFSDLNEEPVGTFCEGMQGLLKECDKVLDKDYPGIVKDAALISALQKCEHYEISSYGSLQTFAKHLDLSDVQDTLQDILEEEADADKNLTSVAEGGWFTSGINAEAVK